MFKKLSIFALLALIILLTQASFAQDSPPEPDYVLFYIERTEEASRWGDMIRVEFKDGRISYDYRILDFHRQGTKPPVITPDGKLIYLITTPPFAYSGPGYLPDQIYAVTPDGNNFRSISPDDRYYYGMSFSPDGNQFAVFTNPVTDAIGFGLAFMDADGTNRRELGIGGGYRANITWAPDGSQVAMVRFENEIVILDVASGEIVAAKPDLQTSWGLNIVNWGGDGQTLYFAGTDADERSGIFYIYTYDIADDTLEIFYDERRVADGSVIISPDKSQLASFTIDEARTRYLTVFDINTADIIQDIEISGMPFEFEDGPLVWSPDGVLIAFTQRIDEELRIPHVFVLDVVSGDLQRISPSDYGAVYPMWLPQ